eukprot:CAMPEP_0118675308 /NCGR_PEP_ID=MMETSP0800-20121206/1379_1 /TAXON_ID=210618 ORGANISM="Striatella unipunctata, Strain CCMP2910" /NCGR_SAMPLE_ID=MMETSP0800 /ASSEMBLY_ACC=CAM_ASM_000638 /LENGTH=134 /DNA_ID=CAMNT_0006570615 /DNA_START=33 /DNA_END=437 /DNA_ORIENTATION=-
MTPKKSLFRGVSQSFITKAQSLSVTDTSDIAHFHCKAFAETMTPKKSLFRGVSQSFITKAQPLSVTDTSDIAHFHCKAFAFDPIEPIRQFDHHNFAAHIGKRLFETPRITNMSMDRLHPKHIRILHNRNRSKPN